MSKGMKWQVYFISNIGDAPAQLSCNALCCPYAPPLLGAHIRGPLQAPRGPVHPSLSGGCSSHLLEGVHGGPRGWGAGAGEVVAVWESGTWKWPRCGGRPGSSTGQRGRPGGAGPLFVATTAHPSGRECWRGGGLCLLLGWGPFPPRPHPRHPRAHFSAHQTLLF